MQQLFQEVANQFQSTNQYDKFIKEASKEFDIKIYKFHLFPVSQALLVYKEQSLKYESKSIELLNCAWYENQRRVYVWFIICFLHYKLIDPNRLLDQDKYWNQIRQMFWGKNIYLIKYQLQTIIKNRGRTIWKANEDKILKQIYPKHQKGQWNEVAKDLYFKSMGEYFKTAKQCRERWQNHLNDRIKRGQWSSQQDLTLFQQVKKNGTKWARIIPFLRNLRTEHMIKNRYKALVNKAMQQRNIKEKEAIDFILRKLTQECPSTSSNGKELDRLEDDDQQDNEEIAFVESEEIVEDVVEMRSDSRLRSQKKRSRTKIVQTNTFEGLRIISKQVNKDEMNLYSINDEKDKFDEIQGCKVIGAPMSHINQYLFVQKSDSFSQSNSNSRSYSNHNIFASGQYSVNYSINMSDGSLMPFDLKEDKKKELQFESMKSIRSVGERPSDSFLLSNYIR